MQDYQGVHRNTRMKRHALLSLILPVRTISNRFIVREYAKTFMLNISKRLNTGKIPNQNRNVYFQIYLIINPTFYSTTN